MAIQSDWSHRTALILVGALVLAGIIMPLATSVGAAQAETGVEANTTQVDSTDYSYDDLTQSAAHPNGAPPSIRPSGSYGEYAIKHQPTGLFYQGDFGMTYADSSTTIKRTSLEFWAKRPYETAANPIPDKSITLHTVLWQRGTATHTENNQTRQVPVATNVTESKHTITLGSGYTTAEIPLPKKWDSSWRLTMFVGEEADTARWQYTYNPSTVAKTISAQSAGERTLFLAGMFALAALAAGASLKVSRKLVKAAGAGPQISMLVWGMLVVPGAFVFFFVLGWDWTVQQLITAPWLFPILLGCLVGFMATVWFGDYTFTDLFIRLKLDDNIPDAVPGDTGRLGAPTARDEARDVLHADPKNVTTVTDGGVDRTGNAREMQSRIDSLKREFGRSESGVQPNRRMPGVRQDISLGEIPGVISADVVPKRMTRYDDGSIGPIRRGLSAFLARAKGAATRLRTDGNPQNRVSVDKGPYENLYFVDPQFDEVIDHTPESWSVEFPALVEKHLGEDGNVVREVNWTAVIGGPTALAIGWIFGGAALNNPPLGAAIAAGVLGWRYVLTPGRSEAYTQLSPIHYDRVVEVVMTHASALAEVTSLEDSWEGWVKSETDRRVERRRMADEKTKTQSESINEEFLASESDAEEDFNADGRTRRRDGGRRGGRR